MERLNIVSANPIENTSLVTAKAFRDLLVKCGWGPTSVGIALVGQQISQDGDGWIDENEIAEHLAINGFTEQNPAQYAIRFANIPQAHNAALMVKAFGDGGVAGLVSVWSTSQLAEINHGNPLAHVMDRLLRANREAVDALVPKL